MIRDEAWLSGSGKDPGANDGGTIGCAWNTGNCPLLSPCTTAPTLHLLILIFSPLSMPLGWELFNPRTISSHLGAWKGRLYPWVVTGKPDPYSVVSEQTHSLNALNGIWRENSVEKKSWDDFKTLGHTEELPPHQEPLAMGFNE